MRVLIWMPSRASLLRLPRMRPPSMRRFWLQPSNRFQSPELKRNRSPPPPESGSPLGSGWPVRRVIGPAYGLT